MNKKIKAINVIQDYIIESEMNGDIDKTDPWFPIFTALEELKDKIYTEEIG